MKPTGAQQLGELVAAKGFSAHAIFYVAVYNVTSALEAAQHLGATIASFTKPEVRRATRKLNVKLSKSPILWEISMNLGHSQHMRAESNVQTYVHAIP